MEGRNTHTHTHTHPAEKEFSNNFAEKKDRYKNTLLYPYFSSLTSFPPFSIEMIKEENKNVSI